MASEQNLAVSKAAATFQTSVLKAVEWAHEVPGPPRSCFALLFNGLEHGSGPRAVSWL